MENNDYQSNVPTQPTAGATGGQPMAGGVPSSNPPTPTSPITPVSLNDKVKKPKDGKKFYNQWWFWVIVAVVLLFIAVGGGSVAQNTENGTDTQTTSTTSENTGGNSTGNSNSSSSSQDKVYAVGDTITAKNSEFTISEVIRNFVTDNQFVTPEDGYEYVKVIMTIKNNDSSETTYYGSDWELIDSSGEVRTEDVMATGLSNDGLTYDKKLSSGGKATVSMVFEVPAGDTGLELTNNSSILGIEQFKVKL